MNRAPVAATSFMYLTSSDDVKLHVKRFTVLIVSNRKRILPGECDFTKKHKKKENQFSISN